MAWKYFYDDLFCFIEKYSTHKLEGRKQFSMDWKSAHKCFLAQMYISHQESQIRFLLSKTTKNLCKWHKEILKSHKIAFYVVVIFSEKKKKDQDTFSTMSELLSFLLQWSPCSSASSKLTGLFRLCWSPHSYSMHILAIPLAPVSSSDQ